MNQRTYGERDSGRLRHRRVRRRGWRAGEGAVDRRIRRRRARAGTVATAERSSRTTSSRSSDEFDDAEHRGRADSDVSNDARPNRRDATRDCEFAISRAVLAAAACTSPRTTGASVRATSRNARSSDRSAGTGVRRLADHLRGARAVLHEGRLGDRRLGRARVPFDPPRSRPYPMPPLPNKSSGVLLERAAKKLGLHAQVCADGDSLAAARWPFRDAWRADTAPTTAASSARSRRRS